MIEETTSLLLEDSGNLVNRTVSELTPFSYWSKRLNHCGARKRPHVAGKFLFIGDEKFYVKGVNYGAFRPDPEKREYRNADQIERDFAQMRAHGINTVRIPHTMPPCSLMDAALRHGLRVMVGLSAEQYVGYLVDTQKARPDLEAIVREKVRTIQGHPGLLCYCIGNEIAASVARWLGRRRVERYLRCLHDAIKAEDPEGIVTYVNYPSTEYLQLPFLDLVCFNVYLESRDQFRAYLARLQNIAEDRPLIMSEVGLDALRNGEAKQAEVLDWQVRLCFASGCAGTVIFSWTDEWHRAGADVEDWEFGITDRQRCPKPALQVVREAFLETPFPRDMPWPRISVVICSYNGSRTIRETLEGVHRLEYPDFELIVVDDGSTDGTSAIAAECGYCRLIKTENAGLSSARNTGLHAATGEIVAYLDDDAIPDPHWLYYIGDAFRQTGHAAIGGPNIAPPHGNIVADCVDNAPGGPVHVLLSDEVAEHIPGCNLAIRKSCLEEVGGFDAAFRVAGDDIDLCWRLQQKGWTLGFIPGAMVSHHRRHTIGGYWNQQKGYGMAEAKLERKWPEKYNSAGHHTFSGRLYGQGMIHAFFRQSFIYHGRGGFAPFQSLYERSPGVLGTLPLMPEWYLIIVALGVFSLLGFWWQPMLLAAPLALTAIALSVAHAVVGGIEASFYTAPAPGLARLQRRILTAFLYLLQPWARLYGRLHAGLTAWRRRGAPGFAFPKPRSSAVWTEDWRPPEERLAEIKRKLRADGAILRVGGVYDRWDVEILGGTFGSARVLMAIEDHGAGTQLVRVRSWPRCRRGGRVLIGVFSLLALLAALDRAWIVNGLLSAVVAVVTWCLFQQAAQAAAALLRVIESPAKTP